MLLDRDFRIQTASAAFTAVTGERYEDVKGRDCRDVFCQGGFCRNCVCQHALASGRIESHIDQTLGRNGRERFLEHVAVPMKENGEIISILEIITDITERKRLEEHLIQTEKLMAAGEMSSIIAHEFRNSLTSIKMILQLQKESQRLSRSDKKSIAVALNSIDHMEGIVTELLNFARPKPMEFRVESLNDIINDSLAFVQVHMGKRSIRVKKTLDPTLPTLLLDAPHFKEALVNVLLNAAQAFEVGNQRSHRGEIRILTKRTWLRKSLHDFAVTEESEKKASGSVGSEIVFATGTECALIEISDTGRGIERKHLVLIFDPFFTTKTNGTGLGLPMVKRTVNAHGGIVT
ncbi:MAG: ATP-binding protein, partial [Bacteroidota bacterium]